MPQAIPLSDHCLLRVTGPDSATFLQGQMTQDVAEAAGGHTVLAGLADAKGRLLWCGHLLRLSPEALGLVVPVDLAEALLQHLRRYVLRSRVQLDLATTSLLGYLDPPGEVACGPLLELAGDPDRRLLLVPDGVPGPAATGSMEAWNLQDIRRGIPRVVAATRGEFIPQSLNLDLLHGVSFTKGCYTGQEIVARTRYLGRVKRRMLRFAVAAPPPPPGVALQSGRGTAGMVVSSAASGGGAELLASVFLEDLGGKLHLAGHPEAELARRELPYDPVS